MNLGLLPTQGRYWRLLSLLVSPGGGLVPVPVPGGDS